MLQILFIQLKKSAKGTMDDVLRAAELIKKCMGDIKLVKSVQMGLTEDPLGDSNSLVAICEYENWGDSDNTDDDPADAAMYQKIGPYVKQMVDVKLRLID